MILNCKQYRNCKISLNTIHTKSHPNWYPLVFTVELCSVNLVTNPRLKFVLVAICKFIKRYTCNKKLSWTCDLDELVFLGPGMPLYFRFIKTCIIMMLIVFVIQGIYTIVLISDQTGCLTLDEIRIAYPELASFDDFDLEIELGTSDYKSICVATPLLK